MFLNAMQRILNMKQEKTYFATKNILSNFPVKFLKKFFSCFQLVFLFSYTTIQCQHVPGNGFVRGSYLCVCLDGYYFPDISAEVKGFNGTVVENYYSSNGTKNLDKYVHFCI